MTTQAVQYEVLGKGRKLIDGLEKVTGTARFAGGQVLPNMLHARPVLSPYAYAKITAINTSEAEQIPGVVAVLTAQDLPTHARVIASRNSAVLAKGEVLFRGQPVVVVIAETEMAAQDGVEAVDIDYEPLDAVVDIKEAVTEGTRVLWPNGLPKDEADLTSQHGEAAKQKSEVEEGKAPPNVHKETHFERGDVEKALAEADVVVERTYTTPFVHQSYMEPHAVLADPDPFKQSMTIYTGTQGQFMVRDEVARLLSLPKSKVRVVPMTLGGGFGAKYGIVEPLASAAATVVKRPVRLVLTRSEDFLTTTPSPATIIELKTGATKDGSLTALDVKVYLDNGIFGFALGGIFGILIGGYYKCDNVRIHCYEVNTNKPQAGAYRAPAAPQATFALESNVDDMADQLGLDRMAFRLQNAAQSGDAMGSGQPWPSLGLKKCLQELQAHPAWRERDQKGEYEGVGIAIGGWPCGMAPAASVCRLDDDGTVRIHVGSVDISGVNSSLVLVAAETLGVSPDEVEIIQGDTVSGPRAPSSGGSQVTYSVAGAVANAALEVKKKLLALAADKFEASVDDLEIKESKVQVKGVPDKAMSVAELASMAQGMRNGPGPLVGEGTSAIGENGPAFVVHLAKVKVDPDTGKVDLTRFISVQDVGFALNPMVVDGQIHGGVVQGVGWGLHEAMIFDDQGELLTASFMDYDIPKSSAVPDIESILIQNPSPHGPFGARGVGEPPIIAPAAAIANAINDATGVRVDSLPIRAEDLWRAMHSNGAS